MWVRPSATFKGARLISAQRLWADQSGQMQTKKSQVSSRVTESTDPTRRLTGVADLTKLTNNLVLGISASFREGGQG